MLVLILNACVSTHWTGDGPARFDGVHCSCLSDGCLESNAASTAARSNATNPATSVVIIGWHQAANASDCMQPCAEADGCFAVQINREAGLYQTGADLECVLFGLANASGGAVASTNHIDPQRWNIRAPRVCASETCCYSKEPHPDAGLSDDGAMSAAAANRKADRINRLTLTLSWVALSLVMGTLVIRTGFRAFHLRQLRRLSPGPGVAVDHVAAATAGRAKKLVKLETTVYTRRGASHKDATPAAPESTGPAAVASIAGAAAVNAARAGSREDDSGLDQRAAVGSVELQEAAQGLARRAAVEDPRPDCGAVLDGTVGVRESASAAKAWLARAMEEEEEECALCMAVYEDGDLVHN